MPAPTPEKILQWKREQLVKLAEELTYEVTYIDPPVTLPDGPAECYVKDVSDRVIRYNFSGTLGECLAFLQGRHATASDEPRARAREN